jgi:hypothetical protein
MPISINLLAEAQAAEEMRRRDPVKRTISISILLVALVIVWSISIQARIMRASSEMRREEAKWKAMEGRHAEVTDNLKKSAQIEMKLAALKRISTNRFFVGTLLNSLQQTMVDDVQAVRIKTDQTFTFVEGTPARTNSHKITPGKPPATIEKVSVVIEAKDWNPVQQNYNKLKEAIAKFPAFKTNLAKADSLRLTSLSKPSYDPSDPLRPFVTFTLEMQYPEVRRE